MDWPAIAADPSCGRSDPWIKQYGTIRQQTKSLCAPLVAEDYVIQSMPDVSPTRWHLAHTTWFFETFVLKRFSNAYREYHPNFNYLFNSYYNSIGEQFPRSSRGVLSRPTVEEVWRYRQYVDEHVFDLLSPTTDVAGDVLRVLDTGLNHEQQHQELILTDIKHVFSGNPLFPVYRSDVSLDDDHEEAAAESTDMTWFGVPEGLYWIGYDGETFSFDNERPRHQEFILSFQIANRLVTNGEFLRFLNDGGYTRPELWLSLGWQTVNEGNWSSPLYWTKRDGQWHEFTLGGLMPLERSAPVSHISYFEADAFARWSKARLPTEAEWEIVARGVDPRGNFAEAQRFRPRPLNNGQSNSQVRQMFGDVWEWTSSPYIAYPGYRPPAGAVGEYNGKFMCNQYVLRGGSCATPASHIRPTYRNFFPPDARWQFSGLRLARDL